MDILFYHLTNLTLEKSLPKLIKKMLKIKLKILIYANNEELLETLDNLLWSYSTRSFIPHATYREQYHNKQPVIINKNFNNINNADILLDLSLEQFDLKNLAYKKLIYIFSNLQLQEVEKAEILYKLYSELQQNIIYYKQKSTGEWEKIEK